MTFHEQLIKLRRAHGLSQEQLGEIAGVSRQTVSKWELGDTTPEMEKLIAISDYFDISIDELVGRTSPDPAKSTISGRFTGPEDYDGHEDTHREGGYHEDVRQGWREEYVSVSHYEYKSERTVFGLPLVHINIYGSKGIGGIRLHVPPKCCDRRGRAKGILAIGNTACGFIAIGGVTLGLIAMGGVAFGLFTLGAVSIGLLLALGAVSVGAVAVGGISMGLLALGGIALGLYAIGGLATAHFIAAGGLATGIIAIGDQIDGEIMLDLNSAATTSAAIEQAIRTRLPDTWEILIWLFRSFV